MCGCTSGIALANNVSNVSHTPTWVQGNTPDDAECDKTREDLEILKALLISRKNPMNAVFVNSQLGLIETMFNYNKYCLYNIEPF
jgi:hypothetical protein